MRCNMLTPIGTKSFFLESMVKILSGNVTQETIACFPGSRFFAVEVEPFKLIHFYMLGKQDGISGSTFIFEDGRLSWRMDFSGWYQEPALLLVNKVVLAEYKHQLSAQHPRNSHEFNGCRGPHTYFDNDHAYSNHPYGGGSFWQFSGIERVVYMPDNKVIGELNYQGSKVR